MFEGPLCYRLQPRLLHKILARQTTNQKKYDGLQTVRKSAAVLCSVNNTIDASLFQNHGLKKTHTPDMCYLLCVACILFG